MEDIKDMESVEDMEDMQDMQDNKKGPSSYKATVPLKDESKNSAFEIPLGVVE